MVPKVTTSVVETALQERAGALAPLLCYCIRGLLLGVPVFFCDSSASSEQGTAQWRSTVVPLLSCRIPTREQCQVPLPNFSPPTKAHLFTERGVHLSRASLRTLLCG